MTLHDFKMWLSGYEEVFNDVGYPDKYRWSKIKEQLDKVTDNKPIFDAHNWRNTLQLTNCS